MATRTPECFQVPPGATPLPHEPQNVASYPQGLHPSTPSACLLPGTDGAEGTQLCTGPRHGDISEVKTGVERASEGHQVLVPTVQISPWDPRTH